MLLKLLLGVYRGQRSSPAAEFVDRRSKDSSPILVCSHGGTLAGMPSISTVLFWLIGSIIAGYLILSELLDVVGRLDLIEQKWPRVGRLLNNRPVRLALILFLLVAVWKDLSERNEEFKPSPLVVNIPGPAAPKLDGYEKIIGGLQQEMTPSRSRRPQSRQFNGSNPTAQTQRNLPTAPKISLADSGPFKRVKLA
jgi:hypothetical protein